MMTKTGIDLSGARVLVVDDLAANIDVLCSILEKNGYNVLVATSGQTALKVAARTTPDLILLDVMMPDMDGFETCRRLKSEAATEDIPVIFLTARNELESVLEGFRAGGMDYLTKPVQFEEVLARIETHLSLRRLQQELKQANLQLEKHIEARTEELRAQNTLFQKFVPKIFTEALDPKHLELYVNLAREEVYTVFSSDVRNFTAFSESITCTECYRFLNSFFGVMEPGIRGHGGFVYQYVGDEIMALFKLEEGRYTDNAVRAAVSIQTQLLVRYNEGRKKAGYEPIRIGVGINTGPVAIGIAGTPDRLDACAFGSTVNLAARCESLTKEFEVSIVITEHTYRGLRNPEAFHIRSLGEVAVRGMEEKVHLYEVSATNASGDQ